MLLAGALVSSIVVGLLRGGNLKHVAEVGLKGWWVYLTAFLLQVAMVWAIPIMNGYSGWIYSISFFLLLIGSYLDRSVSGMYWIVFGLLLNGVVVAANGGKMPVRIPRVGFLHDSQAITHAPMTDSTLMWPLGDIIRLPTFGRHYLLLSPGDMLIALGVFLIVQRLMLPASEKN